MGSIRPVGSIMKAKARPTQIHHALDYRIKTKAKPKYNLSDVYPQTGRRDLTIFSNKSNQLEFELPPRCINLARSKLNFDLEVQPGTVLAGGKLCVRTDCISFIERVEVFTRSGVRLMDLDDQQLWSKLSNTYFQDPSKYQIAKSDTRSFLDNPTKKSAKPWLQIKGEYPISIVEAKDGSAVLNPQQLNKDSLPDPTTGLQTWTTIDAAAQLNYRIPFSLDLGHFRDSILAIDKTLFFGGQVLIVKITTAPYADFLGQTTISEEGKIRKFDSADGNHESSDTNVLTCTSALAANSGVVPLRTSTVKFQNITLRCAFESNPSLIANIKQKVMSKGLSIFVPFVYAFREARTGSGSGKQSTIVRLNRGHGVRLHRLVYTQVPNIALTAQWRDQESKFGTQQAYQEVKDSDSLDGKSSIKSYYTTLNNRRLQERDIVIQDSNFFFPEDSWDYVKDCCEGSLVKSQSDALHNWCHIEDMVGYHVGDDDSYNTMNGLPLSDDLQYAVHADMQSNQDKTTHYVFAVCQRALDLRADNITLV